MSKRRTLDRTGADAKEAGALRILKPLEFDLRPISSLLATQALNPKGYLLICTGVTIEAQRASDVGKQVKPSKSFGIWSGRWESNPTPNAAKRLKLLIYRCVLASISVQNGRHFLDRLAMCVTD